LQPPFHFLYNHNTSYLESDSVYSLEDLSSIHILSGFPEKVYLTVYDSGIMVAYDKQFLISLIKKNQFLTWISAIFPFVTDIPILVLDTFENQTYIPAKELLFLKSCEDLKVSTHLSKHDFDRQTYNLDLEQTRLITIFNLCLPLTQGKVQFTNRNYPAGTFRRVLLDQTWNDTKIHGFLNAIYGSLYRRSRLKRVHGEKMQMVITYD